MGWLDKYQDGGKLPTKEERRKKSKEEWGRIQNQIAHNKSSEQARLEGIRDNFNEVGNSFLWNLPGSISPMAIEDLVIGGIGKGVRALKSVKAPSLGTDDAFRKAADYIKRREEVGKAIEMVYKDLEDPETIRRAVALGIDPDKFAVFRKNLGIDASPNYGSRLVKTEMNINPNQINLPEIGRISANEIGAHEAGHIFGNQNLWNVNYPKTLPSLNANMFQTIKLKEPQTFERLKTLYSGYSTRSTAPTKVDELLGGITARDPSRFNGPAADKAWGYFKNSNDSYGTDVDNMIERLPMFREYRQGMRDSGILKNKWDEITPQHMNEYYKINPLNRINSFLEPTMENANIIREVSKIAPVIGAGTVLANQTEFQQGGEIKKRFLQPTKSMKTGGIVKDDMGYWNPNNHGKVVEINSNNITMNGVNQPLIGVSDTGDVQYMTPGNDYKFKGSKVTEYPTAENGAWLDSYTKGEPPSYENKPLTTGVNELEEIVITGKTTDEARRNASSSRFKKYNEVVKETTAVNLNKSIYNNKGLKNLPTEQKSPAEVQEALKEIETEKYLNTYTYEEYNPVINYIKNTNEYDERIEDANNDYTYKTKSEIQQLQKELMDKGYDIGVTGADGKYGSKTKQAQQLMLSDSALSPETISRYYKNYNDDTKTNVINIQKDLVEKGFLPEKNESGKSNIDGKFGNITKNALLEYNTTGITEDTKGQVFNKIPKKLFDTRCTSGMCQILEMNNVQTGALGLKYVDAWNLHEKMNKAGNSTEVYNIYSDPAFKNITSKTPVSQLKKITQEVKRKSQTKKTDYKVGDIVGLYWPGSSHHADTLKSKTFNTHTGFVSSVKNGVPIITHNVEGKVLNQPYTQLITTWINRPKDEITLKTSYNNQINKQDLNNITVDPTLINNFETKIERILKPSEKIIVSNIIKRAQYNSEHIPEVLGASVDPEWLNAATFAITGVETAVGINASRTREEMNEDDKLRGIVHNIKGTEEKDISLGVGKIKFSALDEFAKAYFDIKSPEDLADDNKVVDVISYTLAKNYEVFSNYAEQYPMLNLQDEDIKNMAILSYNQGTNKLLKIGRNKDNNLSSKEELILLRELYQGTIADVTSTNFNRIPIIGKPLYNTALKVGAAKPEETYISKVNRYINEVYKKPNKNLSSNTEYQKPNWLDTL